MKFAKVSVIVASVLLGTSGLISCVNQGAKSSSNGSIEGEKITTAGCLDDFVGKDANEVPEPSTSHAAGEQSTKAPIQEDAGCANLENELK